MHVQSAPEVRGGVTTLYNATGETLSTGSIVGIGEWLYSPTVAPDQWNVLPLLRALEPTEDHVDNWAIILTGGAAGETVTAAVSGGEWQVLVDVTNEEHKFVAAVSGDMAKLASSTSGIGRILWKESGTGEKFACVVFGRSAVAARRFCRMTNAIYPGDTSIAATELIWNGTGHDDGDTISVDSYLGHWAIPYEVVEFIADGETLHIVSRGRETHFGTLDEDLTYASDADVTVTVDEEEVTISAMCDQVASGKKLASGSSVCIAYRPAQDPPWEVIYGPCPVNA